MPSPPPPSTPDDPAVDRGPRPDLVRALRDSGSVGLGAYPMGVALGLLVVHSGLDWWWASVLSAVVFAGSLEFLLVGLAVDGASTASVAVTAFLVNVRHVFYALSFPLHRVRGRLRRAYSTYTLSDEAYVVTAGRPAEEFTSRRVLWLQASVHLYWTAGATTGALLGTLAPAGAVEHVVGLDFAVTALFTVMTLDAFRARRDTATLLLALTCALLARFALPGQLLVAAFTLLTVGLLVRHAVGRRPADA